MANYSFTIPDDIDNRVINKFCAYHGYQADLEDGTENPQTKKQFFKSVVLGFVKQSVKFQEIREAEETAKTTASEAAESQITIS